MNLSLPSFGFILKVAVSVFLISLAMKMFPQLKSVAGGLTGGVVV